MKVLNVLGMIPLAVSAVLWTPVMAQDVQEEEAAAEETPAARSSRPFKIETINSDLDLRMDFQESEGVQSDGKLSIVPVPILNPTLNAGGGVAALYTFGSGSRRSTVFGGGGATGNGSWLGAAGANLWLGDDSFKVTAVGAYGSLKLKYFGVGEDSVFNDNPIDFSGEGWGVELNPEIEVFDNFYVGLLGRYLDADIVVELPIEWLPDIKVPFKIVTAGVTTEYISTDFPNWPSTGAHVDGRLLYSKETLKIFNFGLPTKFMNFDLSASRYFRLRENLVWAFNARVAGADNDTPFFLKPSVSLRGYQSGEVLNNYIVEGQTELRWMFARKFGVVAFVGVGASSADFDSFGNTTAGYGVGVRYRFSEIDKSNIGFDFAKAGDNFSAYFTLGEAF